MGVYWKIAQDNGILQTTFASQDAIIRGTEWEFKNTGQTEVSKALRKFPDNKVTKWMKNHIPNHMEGLMQMADKMGDYYQLSESVFKVQVIKSELTNWEKRHGMTIAELQESNPAAYDSLVGTAVNKANATVLDYSEVPNSIKQLRKAPIGAPFISFSYLVLPRVLESVTRHPVKSMKYIMMPTLVSQMAGAAGALGGEDDWDTALAKLLDLLRKNDFLIPFPCLGEDGAPV